LLYLPRYSPLFVREFTKDGIFSGSRLCTAIFWNAYRVPTVNRQRNGKINKLLDNRFFMKKNPIALEAYAVYFTAIVRIPTVPKSGAS
jgi:hypothetical protein